MSITKKINKIDGLFHLKGCSEDEIKKAEAKLDFKFPSEYVEYLREFGVISFSDVELTGLNIEGYLNVVEATLKERELNENFPEKFVVVENLAYEGLVAIMSESGSVFLFGNNQQKQISKTFSDYIDYRLNQ